MPQVVHTVGVDAHGPNTHATFAECVAAASPGDMAMVLPGDYPEQIRLPFAMDVIGRVKGKVRFCPPLADAEQTALEREMAEDERAIAAILAQHLGSDALPVGADARNTALVFPQSGVTSDERAGVVCSLHAAPGPLGGRLVDIIIEGGGIAVSGPGNGANEAKQDSRPASRDTGAWTLEGVQVRHAPYDGLHVSGGSYVKLRDCSVSACGGRGCVVMDNATLVAHSTEFAPAGGGLYAGDCADVTLTRCNIDGPVPVATNEPSDTELAAVPALSLCTFLAFRRYVRRVRWSLRDLVGIESARSGHGVMLFGEARLRMEHCFVRRASGTGIVASQSSACTVISSEVLQSREEGVFASGRSRVELTKITIDDAAHSGCLLVENAAVSMTNCTVQQCRGAGILATSSAQLTARGCTVTRNDCDGVRAKGHSSLTLSGCIVRANGLDAVHMASYGPCEITANQLLGTVWTNAPPEGTQEQIWLRKTILAAVEDGAVDSKELGNIMRCLKNAKVDDETQKLVRAALEDGEMDEDDRSLLMSICPKPTITATEWHPRDGGRGSEKLEASLRRERFGAQGQGSLGGQPCADAAVAMGPLTRAIHRMITEEPATEAAATAAASAAAAPAKGAANVPGVAPGAAVEQTNHQLQQEVGAIDKAIEPVHMARERSAAEIQKEMEEKSKPVAAIWGNVDPRTQRRAISR